MTSVHDVTYDLLRKQVEFRLRYDPKIAAADAIETTNDCSAERASMSGVGRYLEMRGSRLANWLLPRDSFAERALWNGRCWPIARMSDLRAPISKSTTRT
jgi:hypothetical protein